MPVTLEYDPSNEALYHPEQRDTIFETIGWRSLLPSELGSRKR